MVKAHDLRITYVIADFREIRPDTSMACDGDYSPLSEEIIAARGDDYNNDGIKSGLFPPAPVHRSLNQK